MKSVALVATSVSLVAAGMVGLAATPVSAATTSLTSTAWTPASVGGGVVPESVALFVVGGAGGSCYEPPGGSGAVIWGGLVVAPADSLTAVPGGQGASCNAVDTGGIGGTGVYAGGAGVPGEVSGSPAPGFPSGAGGGASTVVYLNGSTTSEEIAVAGGGGGAGGFIAFDGNTFAAGGAGGNGSFAGTSGSDAFTDGDQPLAGAGGTPGTTTRSAGLGGTAPTDACDPRGGCGGAGGGGGGTGGGSAATSGSAEAGQEPYAAGGGGGAGGSSLSTLVLPEYTSAYYGTEGYADVIFVDITAGDVSNVTVGDAYSGTDYVADIPGGTWELVGTAGVDYPAELVIDSSTGAISGSSAGATPGTYNVEVRATASGEDPTAGEEFGNLNLSPIGVASVKTTAMTVAGYRTRLPSHQRQAQQLAAIL